MRLTPWADLRARARPGTLARAARATDTLLAALRLDALRRARGLTRDELAERLAARSSHPEIDESADRTDVRVSVLRALVEAIGGELRVIARFPDAEVRLDPPRTD